MAGQEHPLLVSEMCVAEGVFELQCCLLRAVFIERSSQPHQKLLSNMLLNENNKYQNPSEEGV